MTPALRTHFREQLARLEGQALGGLDLAVEALDRALEALDRWDVELADRIVADDDRLDARYLEVHHGILSLLAREAPVATDLRLVAALLHVIRHAERMGDQCVNVAKLIPLAGHEPPRDAALMGTLAHMGRLAHAEVVQARRSFAARDVALARDLVTRDRELNRLNREVFARALALGEDPVVREWATHMLLAARCLERIGDNAVDVGEQTAFVVTGRFEEFADASHPPASGG